MLPLIVGQIEETPDITVEVVHDEPDAEVVDKVTPAKPQDEDEIIEAVTEAEIATTANADAPPPDYEVIQPDKAEGGTEPRKETT